MSLTDGLRSPGFKLLLAIFVGFVLTIPLFSVWLLVYDRQSQSEQASASITAGWGGPQAMSGPVLVIPYRATATETVVQNGQSVTRSNEVMRELTLAPEAVDVSTDIRPEVRKRSIYEAVVYDAKVAGNAHVGFRGVEADTLLVALDRAGVCAAAGSSCSSGASPVTYRTGAGCSGSSAPAAVGSIQRTTLPSS